MKKRWRIIAIVLLSLIAFTGWKLSTPPAFAQFVYKAGGKVEFLGEYRGDSMPFIWSGSGKFRITHMWAYTTTGSPQSLVLALGDQIGDENVFVGPFAIRGTSHGMTFEIGLVNEGGSVNAIVRMNAPFELTGLDNSLSKVWPGWIDVVYGRELPDGLPNYAQYQFLAMSIADMKAIKKLRPNMTVDVGS